MTILFCNVIIVEKYVNFLFVTEVSYLNKYMFGRAGEDFASAYLTAKGHRIIERNYRTKVGELDIVSVKDDRVYFSEVKTRSGDRFGTPAESITPKKLQHIRNAAEVYISRNKDKICFGNMDFVVNVIEVLVRMQEVD